MRIQPAYTTEVRQAETFATTLLCWAPSLHSARPVTYTPFIRRTPLLTWNTFLITIFSNTCLCCSSRSAEIEDGSIHVQKCQPRPSAKTTAVSHPSTQMPPKVAVVIIIPRSMSAKDNPPSANPPREPYCKILSSVMPSRTDAMSAGSAQVWKVDAG